MPLPSVPFHIGSMKERSAARKRAEKAVGAALTGEQRAYPVDSTPDCGQVAPQQSKPPPSMEYNTEPQTLRCNNVGMAQKPALFP
eukprot:scaffold5303_cov21-Tisochrysis_lutea.AAC.2